MPAWLDEAFLAATDTLFALRPSRRPPPALARRALVIAHRGERDDRRVFENTFAAFDPLRGSGVGGIEFDVRWTRDRVPVVYHDADLRRLFGERDRVRDLDAPALQRRHPQLARLDELVRRYVDDFHLMVELKPEPYAEPELQDRRLAEALAPALQRGRCHVLSLAPELFAALPSLPPARTMGIARLGVATTSDEALAAGRGGFSCHYSALTAARIRRHRAAGQAVGCGFPRSRNVLWHEIGRGVDYIFTNAPRDCERWRQEAISPPGTPAPPG